jgi:hypothetical protein
MPDGPVSSSKEHRLTVVTYLRTLTTGLIKAKRASHLASYRLEDSMYLQDLVKALQSDTNRRSSSYQALAAAFLECHDMAWPEICLHVLRVLHVAATPQDLIEDFKAKTQPEGVSEETYVRQMKGLHRQLSGVLPRKEALLYTAKNLRDTRVLDHLMERINSGTVNTFSELFDAVTELRRKYVGETDSNVQKPAVRPSQAAPVKHSVNWTHEIQTITPPTT